MSIKLYHFTRSSGSPLTRASLASDALAARLRDIARILDFARTARARTRAPRDIAAIAPIPAPIPARARVPDIAAKIRLAAATLACLALAACIPAAAHAAELDCPLRFETLAQDIAASESSKPPFFDALDKFWKAPVPSTETAPEILAAFTKARDAYCAEVEAVLKNKNIEFTLSDSTSRFFLITPNPKGSVLNRLASSLKTRFTIDLVYNPTELKISGFNGFTAPTHISMDTVSIYTGKTSSILAHEIRHAYQNARRAAENKSIFAAFLSRMGDEPSAFHSLLGNAYDTMFRLDEVMAHIQGYLVDAGVYRQSLRHQEMVTTKLEALEKALEHPEGWSDVKNQELQNETAYWKSFAQAPADLKASFEGLFLPQNMDKLVGMTQIAASALEHTEHGLRLIRKEIEISGVIADKQIIVDSEAPAFALTSPSGEDVHAIFGRNGPKDWQLQTTDHKSGFLIVGPVNSNSLNELLERSFFSAKTQRSVAPTSPEIWSAFAKELEGIEARTALHRQDFSKIAALASNAKSALGAGDFARYRQKLADMRQISIHQFYSEGF